MNMIFHRKLPIPQEVKEEFPVSAQMAECKKVRDNEIKKIFLGQSDKFLLIIGPCSADNREAVCEYLSRLKRLSEKVSDKILIIPRIYTNKPRTTGDGYKGMLHQPNPIEGEDMLRGIIATRELHMTSLRDYGFSSADEMLYPDNHRYLSDLLSYTAVGARSVENQQHRLTASGLDIPVGMKNPTGGDLSVMMNSIFAARRPHTFIYRGWEVESLGNKLSHAILRGFYDNEGKLCPDFKPEWIRLVLKMYSDMKIEYPAIIIDTNHANSGKKYLKQIEIARDVLHNRQKDADIRHGVKGLMIESYLEDGNQPLGGQRFGCSITDPCLGWEKTEKLVLEIAEKV